MKKQSSTLFSTINSENMDTLTSVVKETLAAGFSGSANRAFTAAELWNIQRLGRTRSTRRFI